MASYQQSSHAFCFSSIISMQRRRNPRISSPPTSHSFSSADDDNHRRNNSRTFGVPNRIWLVIIVLLATILLLHRLLPPSPTPTLPSYASADLKPKNYFNSSSEPHNPFPFCPVNGPTNSLAAKYGPGPLAQTRINLGTGYRIQRVLKRALSGRPVTISVVGGSSMHLFLVFSPSFSYSSSICLPWCGR